MLRLIDLLGVWLLLALIDLLILADGDWDKLVEDEGDCVELIEALFDLLIEALFDLLGVELGLNVDEIDALIVELGLTDALGLFVELIDLLIEADFDLLILAEIDFEIDLEIEGEGESEIDDEIEGEIDGEILAEGVCITAPTKGILLQLVPVVELFAMQTYKLTPSCHISPCIPTVPG